MRKRFWVLKDNHRDYHWRWFIGTFDTEDDARAAEITLGISE